VRDSREKSAVVATKAGLNASTSTVKLRHVVSQPVPRKLGSPTNRALPLSMEESVSISATGNDANAAMLTFVSIPAGLQTCICTNALDAPGDPPVIVKFKTTGYISELMLTVMLPAAVGFVKHGKETGTADTAG
jgi:hypothetical protein